MAERRGAKLSTVVDVSALSKSAAWAWLSHRSAADDWGVRESDARRMKTEPRPSRYKLEALRSRQGGHVSRASSESSLLDSFEVMSISSLLDSYCRKNSNRVESEALIRNRVEGKKVKKGFLPVPVCGSSTNDVIDSQRIAYARLEKGRVVAAEFGRRLPGIRTK